jgi:hypothetical protein
VDLTELELNDVKTSHFDDVAAAETCAIRAPKLRVLTLIMFFDNGCRLSEDFPLLENASISIDDLFGTPDYIDTFRRISNVNRLWFESDSNQVYLHASNFDGTGVEFCISVTTSYCAVVYASASMFVFSTSFVFILI